MKNTLTTRSRFKGNPAAKDLYERLGVGRDAKTSVVRAAYREAAKEHHPDAGGRIEDFERIKLAHDILIDVGRRAKYDATGDASEVEPDNSLVQTLGFISMAFDQAVIACIQKGVDPVTTDLVSAVTGALKAAIAENRKGLTGLNKASAAWTKLLSRFSVKEGEKNLMEDIVRSKIAEIQRGIQQIQVKIQYLDKAVEIVSHHSFRYDSSVVFVPSGAQVIFNVLGS